jgi:hypothetical protein
MSQTPLQTQVAGVTPSLALICIVLIFFLILFGDSIPSTVLSAEGKLAGIYRFTVALIFICAINGWATGNVNPLKTF